MRQKAVRRKVEALLNLALGIYGTVMALDLGEWLHPNHLGGWFREADAFGPLLFMLLMTAAVVINPIPSLPLDLAAGAAFGVPLGTT